MMRLLLVLSIVLLLVYWYQSTAVIIEPSNDSKEEGFTAIKPMGETRTMKF